MADAEPPNLDPSHALHLRVPATVRDAVDRFAGLCGVNRSEAVRLLLLRALEVHEMWPPGRTEVRRAT